MRWLLALLLLALPAVAQELTARATPDLARSRLTYDGGLSLTLGLSQPVPYRLFLLDAPPRLVADFREVDFTGLAPEALNRGALPSLAWGRFLPGWSRLVAELPGPMRIASAAETGKGPAELAVRLEPVSEAAFAPLTGPPALPGWDLPPRAADEAPPPKTRQTGSAPLVVVLDPGHGGLDPGAEAGKLTEAKLMLTFARALKEALARAGMEVHLTREEDIFVPLEERISQARLARADLLLSLHADALPEGEATGATVYTLAAEASDAASQKLAERHDRADLLAGVDLAGHDDEVAAVLMSLARTETAPRGEALAEQLAAAIKGAGLKMHRHPHQRADFSVLKSADMPSVLLELGFLSSEGDRTRLQDPAWRETMVQALVTGIEAWAQADAAEARLLRQ